MKFACSCGLTDEFLERNTLPKEELWSEVFAREIVAVVKILRGEEDAS